MKSVQESDKMSVAECRKVFAEKFKNCDDVTLKKIRDWLYQMSSIALDIAGDYEIESIEDLNRILEEKNKGKPK
jgi:hypothetical protein